MAEKLIPLEDAQAIVLSHVAPTDLVEIPVWQAAGLPLAEDAVADIDISPFANSAMDGYAVRSADLAQASGEAPVTLDVIGHEAADVVLLGERENFLPAHRLSDGDALGNGRRGRDGPHYDRRAGARGC